MARVGGAQAFFDVLATFNARRLIADQQTAATIMQAAFLDAFNTIVGELSALGMIMDEFTDKVKDVAFAFEDARIEFEKFAAVPDESAAIMVDNIVGMGNALTFTGEEALDAAGRMAQMGAVIGKSNIELGTFMGLNFALISGLNTETAMRRMTNLAQATGFAHEKLGELAVGEEQRTLAQFRMMTQSQQNAIVEENFLNVLDQLNTVENRSIATMDQLTFTMNQFAAQADLAGASISEMAAQSATLIEAGEQQGAAGRALRMMYARLGGDVAGAREEMEAYGIEVINSEGAMNSLGEIMAQLKEKGWDATNAAQKQAIAQSVAGNRHYVRFIKLMENYSRSVELTVAAEQRLDPALDEVTKRMNENVNTLRQVQAETDALNVSMGQHLLPGMIAGAEKTRLFRQELERFVAGEHGEGFKNIANMLVAFRETTTIMAPMIQMQLVVRGLVVGIGVLRSQMLEMVGITQAVGYHHGRATAHMKQQHYWTASHRDLAEEVSLLAGRVNDQKTKQIDNEKRILSLTEHKNAIEQQLLQGSHAMQNAGLRAQQLKLMGLDRENMLMMELRGLGAAISGTTKQEMDDRRNLLEMSWMRENVDAETLMTMKAQSIELKKQIEAIRTRIIENDVEYTRAVALQQLNRNKYRDVDNMLDVQRFLNGEYAAEIGLHKKIKGELESEEYHMMRAAMYLDKILIKMDFYERAIEQVGMYEAELDQIRKSSVITVEQRAALTAMLLKLETELNQEQIEALTIEQLLAQVEDSLIHKRRQLIIESDAARASQAGLNAELSRGQLVMAQFRAGMGGATAGLQALSMGSMMFGDSAYMMRLSMLAMTASLVPATAQMFRFAYSTSVAAGAAVGLTTVLSVATGAVLAIGAAAAVAYWFFDDEPIVDTADAMQDVNAELMQFEQTINRLQAEESTRIFTDLEESLFNIFPELQALNYELEQLFADSQAGENLVTAIQTALKSPGLRDDTKEMLEDNLQEAMLAVDVGKLRRGEDFDIVASPLADLITADMFPKELKMFMGEGWRKGFLKTLQEEGVLLDVVGEALTLATNDLGRFTEATEESSTGLQVIADDVKNLTDEIYNFSGAREELFFGGQYGNVTGSLYRQVVQQGVGTLYHKNEVIMSNNFHGFFNEEEAATRIIDILNDYFAER